MWIWACYKRCRRKACSVKGEIGQKSALVQADTLIMSSLLANNSANQILLRHMEHEIRQTEEEIQDQHSRFNLLAKKADLLRSLYLFVSRRL